MFVPAGQAAGCTCAAGVMAGSVWSQEKQQGLGWSWDMQGWGQGLGVGRFGPEAPLGVLLMGLPQRSQQPAVEELPAAPQERGGGGIQSDSGGHLKLKLHSHWAAAAAPVSCD